ncbi:Uma2 family endonuclease [Leptothoe spongobia]|uniref:Uma2 family endonuclease n=1 Tax=Leptothoe spongobia TAU-MAC 1115 TaxID=1967444 RepID=A0A947DIV8_9CYAN|nr:Uma2 family endonuclease [Leptothoe spongobia]MBT9317762.1 Uma2 family endonuclease [Leptothoe spongobia TAU-MAC 1115]
MRAIKIKPMRWTVEDLEGLPDNGNRYEIIDGALHMTRAPHVDHQDVAGAIYSELRVWSKQSGLGRAAFAPGVIFSSTDAVIPDVVWASHEKANLLLDESGHFTGAPEIVIEVLPQSPKDKERDKKTKLKLYSNQGVLEYWIFEHRELSLVEVYRREAGQLVKTMTLNGADTLTSPILPGFSCSVVALFE